MVNLPALTGCEMILRCYDFLTVAVRLYRDVCVLVKLLPLVVGPAKRALPETVEGTNYRVRSKLVVEEVG